MKSFLSQLSELESRIIGGSVQNYSDYTRQVLARLISYVEGAEFNTSSRHTKFICSNFRLTSSQMCQRWNDTEIDDTDFKTEEAFRSQISTISKQLYGLFGKDCFGVFINENKVGIELVDETIDMLKGYPDNIEDFLIPQIVQETDGRTYTTKYSLEELKETLSALRPLTRRSIWNVIDNIDADKLVYIVYQLKQPLVSNRKRDVNIEKLEIIRELGKEKGTAKPITYPIESFIELLDKRSNGDNSYEDSEANRRALKELAAYYTDKGFQQLVKEKHISNQDMKVISCMLKQAVNKKNSSRNNS